VPAVAAMLAGRPTRLVSENTAGDETPVTVALTAYAPAVLFAVNTGEVATPLALVVTVAVAPVPGAANVPLAPVDGAVKVTDAPLMGLPPLSFTVACKTANAVLIVTLCGVPDVAAMLAGGPAVLLIENEAGAATPLTVALTVNAPTVAFAVKMGAVATPFEPVGAVAVRPPLLPPKNVPLAPLDGVVNVTTAPLNKFPPLSFTVTARFVENAVLITALAGVPALAVIENGAPVRLVSEKLAGPTVPAVAVTV
jgi:hypothetical protein